MRKKRILAMLKRDNMERLYNLLGWSTTGTSLIVNIQAALGSIDLNEAFTVLISALSALFIVIKILKERLLLKEERYKLQIKKLEYDNKKAEKLDIKTVSDKKETYRNSPAFGGCTTYSAKEQRSNCESDCASGN